MRRQRLSRALRLRRPRSRFRAGRGQSMVEYAVVVAFALLALVGAVGFFLDGVGDFYKNVQYIVCSPFP